MAEIVYSLISNDFQAYLWTHGLFTPGEYPLEVFEQQTRSRDFAVLVATPDDSIIKRGQSLDAIRDNVLFELGFFMGVLGRGRTFVLVPQHEKLAIPSDLAGLTQIRYDAERFNLSYQDQLAALQAPCITLRNTIQSAWGRKVAEKERELRDAGSTERSKAIIRLNTMIVKLRDLFIVFPAQLFRSFADHQRFEEIKAKTALSVDSIASPFRDDATVAGLVQELEELVDATKRAVMDIPYPNEIPLSEDKAFDLLKASAPGIMSAIGDLVQRKKSLSDVTSMFETEVTRRISAVADRYTSWWESSQGSINRATSKLQTALTFAAIDQGRQLPSNDTRQLH